MYRVQSNFMFNYNSYTNVDTSLNANKYYDQIQQLDLLVPSSVLDDLTLLSTISLAGKNNTTVYDFGTSVTVDLAIFYYHTLTGLSESNIEIKHSDDGVVSNWLSMNVPGITCPVCSNQFYGYLYTNPPINTIGGHNAYLFPYSVKRINFTTPITKRFWGFGVESVLDHNSSGFGSTSEGYILRQYVSQLHLFKNVDGVYYRILEAPLFRERRGNISSTLPTVASQCYVNAPQFVFNPLGGSTLPYTYFADFGLDRPGMTPITYVVASSLFNNGTDAVERGGIITVYTSSDNSSWSTFGSVTVSVGGSESDHTISGTGSTARYWAIEYTSSNSGATYMSSNSHIQFFNASNVPVQTYILRKPILKRKSSVYLKRHF